MLERITRTHPEGSARFGHEFRYHLAAGFIEHGDTVLDAACGSGYGYWLLRQYGPEKMIYVGVDKDIPADLPPGPRFDQADLSNYDAPFEFDVFVGFETIEHVDDVFRYCELAAQARKWMLVSAPIVPTKHMNPYHLHDFEPGQLRGMLERPGWEHFQTIPQPSEVSEIVVMRRNDG